MSIKNANIKRILAALGTIASCLCLSSCDIKLVDTTTISESQTTSSVSETTTAATSDDSWQTGSLQSSLPETPPLETTVSETTTVPEETSVPLSIPEDTVLPASSKTEQSETEPNLRSSFNATVLSAERKYIIVKPEIESDEFEVSRKIIVYCPQAVDLNAGDSVSVSYSGEFDTYENDLPVISVANCKKTASGGDIPNFISETRIAEVEVVRVYTDGFLGKVVKDSDDFTEGDRVNIDTADIEDVEKGQIIEVSYKESPTSSEDDFPSITADTCKITFSPSFVVGTVSAINDKGIVLSYIDGTFDAAADSDIIIISDIFSDDIDENDVLKIIYSGDVTEEPYIIYDVESYEREDN